MLADNTTPVKELPEGAAKELTPEQQAKVDATKARRAELGGVLETRSQEEIVNDMVKAEEESALKKAEQISPADRSAQFWMQFWPQYRLRIMNLSNKDCKRLLEALVQWPLYNEDPSFHSQQAKEAFAIGLRLIDSKTIMRDTIELEMLNKRAQEAEQNKENATSQEGENKGEVNNG